MVGWGLNLKTGALTEYSNYPFNSICQFNGRYLGASSSGLFKLTGDTDNGTEIPAHIKTGKLDFGTSQLKRIKDVYVALQTLGDWQVAIVTDENIKRTYATVDGEIVPHTGRVNCAKGSKGRYHSIGVANVAGADFEIDNIEINADVLSRRIKTR
jgi:hypothetical protein